MFWITTASWWSYFCGGGGLYYKVQHFLDGLWQKWSCSQCTFLGTNGCKKLLVDLHPSLLHEAEFFFLSIWFFCFSRVTYVLAVTVELPISLYKCYLVQNEDLPDLPWSLKSVWMLLRKKIKFIYFKFAIGYILKKFMADIICWSGPFYV